MREREGILPGIEKEKNLMYHNWEKKEEIGKIIANVICLEVDSIF